MFRRSQKKYIILHLASPLGSYVLGFLASKPVDFYDHD